MLSTLTFFGFVAAAVAQGVTERLEPESPAPPGCRVSDDRTFSISTVNATTARLVKRQDDMGELTIELADGVLTSNRGDTGYIADNDQFQFDSPPQTGAVFTAGFSICPNNTLALGGSTIFYSCLSGGFSNLYSASQGEQCSQVFIEVIEGDAVTPSPSASSSASATSYNTPPPSPTSASVSSIADGQPQGPTEAPSAISSIADGQPQAPTAAPTPSPIYTAGAPATGASLVLAGAGLLAAVML